MSGPRLFSAVRSVITEGVDSPGVLDELHAAFYEERDAARAASPSPEPTPGLREAAQEVVSMAEPDDDYDGDFIDYLVPGVALDNLRAALAASPAPEPTGLDAAWAEAETALPEGWAITMLWGTTTEERWGASAGPWPSKHGDPNALGGGDTPAAALRALAALLREREA